MTKVEFWEILQHCCQYLSVSVPRGSRESARTCTAGMPTLKGAGPSWGPGHAPEGVATVSLRLGGCTGTDSPIERAGDQEIAIAA